MPNGGSDCCGTCWFNRSNGGKAGFRNHDHEIPSYCEIRQLEIESPFYTYCANHPYNRPDRDPIPIGPVYVGEYDTEAINQYRRVVWRQAPDDSHIREHLLDIMRDPGQHEQGYPLSVPSYEIALEELIRLREPRLLTALEQLASDPRVAASREDIMQLRNEVRKRLESEPG